MSCSDGSSIWSRTGSSRMVTTLPPSDMSKPRRGGTVEHVEVLLHGDHLGPSRSATTSRLAHAALGM